MSLNELRNKAYRNAVTHGFHDKELSNEHCFCLIISELMEAMEADRKGKHADRESFKSSYEDEEPHDDVNFKYCFEKYIKDTISDELSEAVIRLLDLAGLRGISLELANGDIEDCIEDMAEAYKDETFTESIYSISTLPARYEGLYDFPTTVNDMVLSIFGFAKHLSIDLIWHIEKKMRYNELRPMLNGKRY